MNKKKCIVDLVFVPNRKLIHIRRILAIIKYFMPVGVGKCWLTYQNLLPFLFLFGLFLRTTIITASPISGLLVSGSSAPLLASSSASSSKNLIWPDEIEDNALAEHDNGDFIYKQSIMPNSRNGAKHEQQQQHQQSSSSIFFWPSTGHHHSRHSRNGSASSTLVHTAIWPVLAPLLLASIIWSISCW